MVAGPGKPTGITPDAAPERHECTGRAGCLRPADRRDHDGDPARAAGRFPCGAGHARQDVPGEPVSALLRGEPDRGRERGAPGMPAPRTGSRCAAGGAGRPGGRLRQLQVAGDGSGRPRSPWPSPTICTAGGSARCCSSTWSHWPQPGGPHVRRGDARANALMMQVFADAGLGAQRALADGVYEVRFPLPAGQEGASAGPYRDAVAERERSADVASLRHVLAPASVAVIGAPRHGSVGGPSCITSSTTVFPVPSTRSTRGRPNWARPI